MHSRSQLADSSAGDALAKPGAVYYLGRAVLRPLIWLLFRPRVEGRHLVPSDGPVLFVSNHLSGWDTLLIPVIAPRPVQFLTKSQFFTGTGLRGSVQRWFFTSVGGVSVARSGGGQAQDALLQGAEILNAGRAFAVFPEGTRSRDGKLKPGKSGAAWMALTTGATVIPVGLIGSADLVPFGYLRGRRPAVFFGEPIQLADLVGMPGGVARRETTQRMMSAISALTGQQRS